MPLNRSLTEILALHWEACKADLHKCIPATVTAVDATHQTVDVQIAVNGLLFDDLGTAVSVPAPSIAGVPLGCLRGGGFCVWLPVAVGDSVMLHFTDRSLDSWSAGDGTPSDPGSVAQHSADSCYAVPMVAPTKKALASPGSHTSDLVIGKDGADEQIVVSGSDIKLGASASDFVALAAKIDLLITVLTAGTYTPAAPETGFASFMTALSTWKGINWTGPGATTAATLVKAK